jgi:pimeloyl-ACP methyl ester carboxylesterase
MRALGRLLYPDSGGTAAASKEEWLKTNQALFAEPANKKAVRHQLRAILKHNTGAELHKLGAHPTLIMHGEKDLLIGSSAARRLHALIPESRLHIFPHSGHGLTHQNADEINKLLLAHFQSADLGVTE